MLAVKTIPEIFLWKTQEKVMFVFGNCIYCNVAVNEVTIFRQLPSKERNNYHKDKKGEKQFWSLRWPQRCNKYSFQKQTSPSIWFWNSSDISREGLLSRYHIRRHWCSTNSKPHFFFYNQKKVYYQWSSQDSIHEKTKYSFKIYTRSRSSCWSNLHAVGQKIKRSKDRKVERLSRDQDQIMFKWSQN